MAQDAGNASPVQWADFDHLTAGAMEDPAPMLRELRESCPVGFSEQHGGFWVLARYADVARAARDPETFGSAPNPGPGPGFPYSDKYPVQIPMIGSDPPLHRDFREPLHRTFSVAHARSMAPAIRQIITKLIDGFIERGHADLVTELTVPLPAQVTGDLLDLPLSSRAEFHEWASEIVATGGDTPAFAHLLGYIDALYQNRTSHSGDDIPSAILNFRIDGRSITREEWIGMVLLLILAGLDTTANGGALILHFLATRPDLRTRLVENPELIPTALEELLRWETPVPQHSRGVRRDVEIGGCALKAGDVVELQWMAANRDPDEFPDPETFLLQRNPNRHFAFGTGPHRCLGSHLARVELTLLLQEVLGRLPDYELVPGGTVRYPGLNRGMSHLEVSFTAGRAAASS